MANISSEVLVMPTEEELLDELNVDMEEEVSQEVENELLGREDEAAGLGEVKPRDEGRSDRQDLEQEVSADAQSVVDTKEGTVNGESEPNSSGIKVDTESAGDAPRRRPSGAEKRRARAAKGTDKSRESGGEMCPLDDLLPAAEQPMEGTASVNDAKNEERISPQRQQQQRGRGDRYRPYQNRGRGSWRGRQLFSNYNTNGRGGYAQSK